MWSPVYPRTQSPANASPYAQPAAVTADEACASTQAHLARDQGERKRPQGIAGGTAGALAYRRRRLRHRTQFCRPARALSAHHLLGDF